MDEFSGLVEAHGREIFHYLWRMTYNNQDAEDCLQETFLKAFRAYPRLAPGSNHRAWLYRIATNTARTYMKRSARQVQQFEEWSVVLKENNPAPTRRIETHETMTRVLSAVEALPTKQKASLLLRKYHDLTYAEIAKITETSPTAARANVYLALKTLQVRLKGENLEDVPS